MNLSIFIISWVGQHEKAAAIAQALDAWRDRTAIVYSDPDPAVEPQAACRRLRRPNDLFWSDKFLACLEASENDLMLVLHADCHCDDWAGLVRKCQQAFASIPRLGKWAPLMRGCYFEIEATRLGRINHTSLSMAANTDAICFAIAPAISARMRRADYSDNTYGWGIAWMMTTAAHCNNMIVAVDESIEVRHPPERGYRDDDALAQMNRFLKQLSVQETAQFILLNHYITSRKRQLKNAGK